jgi:hypothetical protein
MIDLQSNFAKNAGTVETVSRVETAGQELTNHLTSLRQVFLLVTILTVL